MYVPTRVVSAAEAAGVVIDDSSKGDQTEFKDLTSQGKCMRVGARCRCAGSRSNMPLQLTESCGFALSHMYTVHRYVGAALPPLKKSDRRAPLPIIYNSLQHRQNMLRGAA